MSKIELVSGYTPGALGRITELHGTYYARHWNFGLFFEAINASQMAEFLTRFNPAQDGFWTAQDNGQIIGGITIDGKGRGQEGARLRWFILDPAYQGQGLGHRLINTALTFCREKSFHRVYLTTFAGLDTARHLYEQAGFKLYDEHEGNQWGTTLLEQKFEVWLS